MVGTSSMLKIDGDEISHYQPAPQSRYRLIKIVMDNDAIQNIQNVIGPKNGLKAFLPPFNPGSGAIYLTTVNSED